MSRHTPLRHFALVSALKQASLLTLVGFMAAPASAGTIVGAAGVTETFATPPPATSWSTATIAGGPNDITTPAQMDTAVAALTSASIATALPVSAASPPAAAALAQYNNVAKNVQTRPITASKLTPLMASLENGTGVSVNTLSIDYDLGAVAPVAESPGLEGHRVYLSLTGASGSWMPFPSVSGIGTAGKLSGTFELDTLWTEGAPLYVLWADDNGPAATDTGFSLDNVRFVPKNRVVYNLAHTVGEAPNGKLDLSGNQYFLKNGNPVAYAAGNIAIFSQNGTATVDVPADIAPLETRVTHASGTYTIGGAGKIAGPLLKSDTGTLVLSSANSFTKTTFTGGTIVTQAVNALGTGPLQTDAPNTTLRTEADLTVAGLNGAGQLTKTGAGTLTITTGVASNASGGMIVQGGKFRVATATGFGGPQQAIFLDGGTLEAGNTTGDLVYSTAANLRTIAASANGGTFSVPNGPGTVGLNIEGTDSLSGSGPLTKTGPGALRLRAEQSLTSNWTVNGGTLEYGSSTIGAPIFSAIGPGSVTVNAGGRFAIQGTTDVAQRNVSENAVFLNGGELGVRTNNRAEFSGPISVAANSTANMISYTTPATSLGFIISGVVSGSAELSIIGNNPATPITEALRLTNDANTFSGTFRVGRGQILASEPADGNGSALGTAGVVLSGSTLRILDSGTTNSGTLPYGNNLTVDTATSILTVDRAVGGTRTGNTVALGGLSIGAQTLRVNSANGYKVEFNGASALTGNAILETNADVAIQGAVSGGFGLTKTGTGRLLLNGTNTYSGPTTINAGTLGGTGSLAGALSVLNNNTQLAPGVVTAGIFSIGGSVSLGDGVTLAIDIAHAAPGLPIAGSDYDRLAIGTGDSTTSMGGLTLGAVNLVPTLRGAVQGGDLFFIVENDGSDPVAGTFAGLADNQDFTIGGQPFRISYDANEDGYAFDGGNDIALLAVPEPGSASFVILASALLLRRRRSRARS